MATAKDFRRVALSLDGTAEAPHFDRTAFKVKRIYATLAGGEKTANLMFVPDEQALKCEIQKSPSRNCAMRLRSCGSTRCLRSPAVVGKFSAKAPGCRRRDA
jgi:hypothetical protein